MHSISTISSFFDTNIITAKNCFQNLTYIFVS